MSDNVDVREAIEEISEIKEDLYYVANLLNGAGRSRLAQEAADLALHAGVLHARIKKELKR